MIEFVTRWLVCLVLLAVIVQSERTIKGMATTEMNKLDAALTEMGIEDFTGGKT